jgi:hypothetical protein
MNKVDIDKLLELRAAWDKLKSSKHSEDDRKAFYSVTWKYGIERPDEIANFNDKMLFQFIEEYIPLVGKCDKCDGYKGTPPCKELYRDKSCFAADIPEGVVKKKSVLDFFDAIRAGMKPAFSDDRAYHKTEYTELADAPVDAPALTKEGYRILYGVCPPGHGRYNIIKLRSYDGLPFDIYWVP